MNSVKRIGPVVDFALTTFLKLVWLLIRLAFVRPVTQIAKSWLGGWCLIASIGVFFFSSKFSTDLNIQILLMLNIAYALTIVLVLTLSSNKRLSAHSTQIYADSKPSDYILIVMDVFKLGLTAQIVYSFALNLR